MIIFLSGPNHFAIKQAADTLTDRFARKFGIAGLERVDGATLEPQRLAELLQGASLFAPQRLVVLKNASANKPAWEMLADWLPRVPAETTLLVVDPAVDKRTRTYKQLKQHADCQEFPELQPPQLTAWLQKTAPQLGGSINAKTANHLVRRVGTDQWRLWQELQKLISFNPAVSVQAVDTLVDPSPQASAFDLLDAVTQRQAARARDLLANLATLEDPYRVFGLLVSQIHTLAIVQSAPSKNPDLLAKEAGIHPFVVRKMQSAARGMGDAELQDIIDSVALLDTQLKSTGVDPWLLLGQCMQKIASRAG